MDSPVVGWDNIDEMSKQNLGGKEKGKMRQQMTSDEFGGACKQKGKK